jgi:hypothetical protein
MKSDDKGRESEKEKQKEEERENEARRRRDEEVGKGRKPMPPERPKPGCEPITGGGWGSPSEFCFPQGTLIQMADGLLRQIQEICPGDYVQSWDVRRGVLATSRVVRVLAAEVERMIRINRRLTASPAHRILSARGYLRFDEIDRGDVLFCPSGLSFEPVSTVDIVAGRHCVHNLVVTPYASFIAEGLLVEDQDGEEIWNELAWNGQASEIRVVSGGTPPLSTLTGRGRKSPWREYLAGKDMRFSVGTA